MHRNLTGRYSVSESDLLRRTSGAADWVEATRIRRRFRSSADAIGFNFRCRPADESVSPTNDVRWQGTW
jgi:hypothetical protein